MKRVVRILLLLIAFGLFALASVGWARSYRGDFLAARSDDVFPDHVTTTSLLIRTSHGGVYIGRVIIITDWPEVVRDITTNPPPRFKWATYNQPVPQPYPFMNPAPPETSFGRRFGFEYSSRPSGTPTKYGAGWNTSITLPFWFINAVLGLVVTAAGLRVARLFRASKAGKCPACGYDLRATPDQCPECGLLAPQSSTKNRSK